MVNPLSLVVATRSGRLVSGFDSIQNLSVSQSIVYTLPVPAIEMNSRFPIMIVRSLTRPGSRRFHSTSPLREAVDEIVVRRSDFLSRGATGRYLGSVSEISTTRRPLLRPTSNSRSSSPTKIGRALSREQHRQKLRFPNRLNAAIRSGDIKDFVILYRKLYPATRTVEKWIGTHARLEARLPYLAPIRRSQRSDGTV